MTAEEFANDFFEKKGELDLEWFYYEIDGDDNEISCDRFRELITEMMKAYALSVVPVEQKEYRMKQLSPREYLEEIGIIINEDNESFDCELEWSMVMDIMSMYAKRVSEIQDFEQES